MADFSKFSNWSAERNVTHFFVATIILRELLPEVFMSSFCDLVLIVLSAFYNQVNRARKNVPPQGTEQTPTMETNKKAF